MPNPANDDKMFELLDKEDGVWLSYRARGANLTESARTVALDFTLHPEFDARQLFNLGPREQVEKAMRAFLGEA